MVLVALYIREFASFVHCTPAALILPTTRTLLMSSPPPSPPPRPTIRSGMHTYASWKNKNTDDSFNVQGDDDLYSFDDYDENNEDVVFQNDAKRNPERDNNYRADSNPLVEWIRKVYDAIFFYGLDAQVPPSKSKRSRGRGKRRKVGKKSLFFTSMEQLGQDFISVPDQYVNRPKVQYSQTSANKKISTTANDGDETATLQRRIQVLDECMKNMMSDLDIIDESLKNEKNKCSDIELMKQKQNIIDAVEALQVQYVDLCVELEEKLGN